MLDLRPLRRSTLDEIRDIANDARRLAYFLEPLKCDDVDALARDVDELANVTHMLAVALLKLCDELEKGGPA